jgi:hypothetical protein
MNLQSLLVVALRLMVIDFLLQLVRVAMQYGFQFLVEPSPSSDNPGTILAVFFMSLLSVCILAAAIFIWAIALPIAERISRGVPHDITLGSLTLADCYSVAFMGIGLYYVIGESASVLNLSFYWLKNSAPGNGNPNDGLSGYDISQSLVPFIAGVMLFVKSRQWAVALARHQGKPAQPTP